MTSSQWPGPRGDRGGDTQIRGKIRGKRMPDIYAIAAIGAVVFSLWWFARSAFRNGMAQGLAIGITIGKELR